MNNPSNEQNLIEQSLDHDTARATIKTIILAPFLLIVFPGMLITFGGFLITLDTIWLERGAVLIRYWAVGLVFLMCLFSLIGGVSLLVSAYKKS